MKLCPRCNTERPVEDFHRDKTKSSGRRSACKYCINNKITGKPKFKEDKFCVNCSTVLVKDQKLLDVGTRIISLSGEVLFL